MKICYSFPSRSRPERFFKTLDNIRDMSASQDYFILAKLDSDDSSMNNDLVKIRIKKYKNVIVKWGKSEGKVHAVNRGMEDLPDCDIIIIMSDDIVWDVYGFDDEIRSSFKKFFPGFDGTIHYPDDNGKANTIIVSILGVNLYKRLGYLYCPEYMAVYCDNEFTEVTRRIGKYIYVNKRLFTHNHPIWTKQGWDDLYRSNESPEVYKKDREVFMKRQSNNFYLHGE
jgi:hypothetical protein